MEFRLLLELRYILSFADPSEFSAASHPTGKLHLRHFKGIDHLFYHRQICRIPAVL
jgi:hypothetical protein